MQSVECLLYLIMFPGKTTSYFILSRTNDINLKVKIIIITLIGKSIIFNLEGNNLNNNQWKKER